MEHLGLHCRGMVPSSSRAVPGLQLLWTCPVTRAEGTAPSGTTSGWKRGWVSRVPQALQSTNMTKLRGGPNARSRFPPPGGSLQGNTRQHTSSTAGQKDGCSARKPQLKVTATHGTGDGLWAICPLGSWGAPATENPSETPGPHLQEQQDPPAPTCHPTRQTFGRLRD